MNYQRSKTIFTESDEAVAPTRDVLLAVSGALRGDRKRVRVLVAKAQGRIQKRLQRELRALGRSKPPPAKQKPKIRGARLAPPARLPPVAPTGTGSPTAGHRNILALGHVSSVNTQRAFEAISHNGRAIDQLAASQQALADRLAKLQSNGDMALLRGIVEGLSKLERRLDLVRRRQDKALGTQKRSVQKKLVRQERTLKAQTRAAKIQQLQVSVASLQSAAYGTKGSLLATNNILLAVNQLGWSFIPRIVEALGLAKPDTISTLAWLTPLGSLLTSHAVLGRRQHERFISEIASVQVMPIRALRSGASPMLVAIDSMGGGFGEITLSLKSYIAPAEWDAFSSRRDVTVTTAITNPGDALEIGIWVRGQVSGGRLTIRVFALTSNPTTVVVSWTVDTRRPDD